MLRLQVTATIEEARVASQRRLLIPIQASARLADLKREVEKEVTLLLGERCEAVCKAIYSPNGFMIAGNEQLNFFFTDYANVEAVVTVSGRISEKRLGGLSAEKVARNINKLTREISDQFGSIEWSSKMTPADIQKILRVGFFMGMSENERIAEPFVLFLKSGVQSDGIQKDIVMDWLSEMSGCQLLKEMLVRHKKSKVIVVSIIEIAERMVCSCEQVKMRLKSIDFGNCLSDAIIACNLSHEKRESASKLISQLCKSQKSQQSLNIRDTLDCYSAQICLSDDPKNVSFNRMLKCINQRNLMPSKHFYQREDISVNSTFQESFCPKKISNYPQFKPEMLDLLSSQKDSKETLNLVLNSLCQNISDNFINLCTTERSFDKLFTLFKMRMPSDSKHHFIKISEQMTKSMSAERALRLSKSSIPELLTYSVKIQIEDLKSAIIDLLVSIFKLSNYNFNVEFIFTMITDFEQRLQVVGSAMLRMKADSALNKDFDSQIIQFENRVPSVISLLKKRSQNTDFVKNLLSALASLCLCEDLRPTILSHEGIALLVIYLRDEERFPGCCRLAIRGLFNLAAKDTRTKRQVLCQLDY